MSRPPFHTCPILNGAPHGFFGRLGGVSKGEYESLNCGPGSGDLADHVQTNRDLCQKALQAHHLQSVYQFHSAQAVFISKYIETPPKADAMVTDQTGLALGILTADCMPVLFYDPVAHLIGAAHAGWRGLLAGILEATLSLMITKGAAPENIRAVIGPCLRNPNFETGADMRDLFLDSNPDTDQYFTPMAKPGKWLFDPVQNARHRFTAGGLRTENIGDIPECTLALPDKYFSYRYSKKTNLKDYGRNLSAIVLPD
ncbi:MAG: peptidoglycan editing factor PgeF [bacterium]